MVKYLSTVILAAIFLACGSCGTPKDAPASAGDTKVSVVVEKTPVRPVAANAGGNDPAHFLPEGYVLFERIDGDLDKDGQDDCILIIKGTDTNMIVKDDSRGRLDRNRRGIVILLNKNGRYRPVARNYDCFSSENEDGGVYFAPELVIETGKGNLYIHYAHGRYGYWRYTFRFAYPEDFELIGYDASNNSGPRVDRAVSINYLTRKKIVKENTNADAEGGDEVFAEHIERIKPGKLLRLSEIKDFDELDSAGD